MKVTTCLFCFDNTAALSVTLNIFHWGIKKLTSFNPVCIIWNTKMQLSLLSATTWALSALNQLSCHSDDNQEEPRWPLGPAVSIRLDGRSLGESNHSVMLTTSENSQCFVEIRGVEVQKGPLSPSVSVRAHSVALPLYRKYCICFWTQGLPFHLNSH